MSFYQTLNADRSEIRLTDCVEILDLEVASSKILELIYTILPMMIL
jgi:hypothetical protein